MSASATIPIRENEKQPLADIGVDMKNIAVQAGLGHGRSPATR